MIAHRAMLAAGATMVRSRGLTREDVFYGGAPISHVMGGSALLSVIFTAGACMRLMAGFAVDELARWIANGDLTFLMAVPALHARLIEHIAASGIVGEIWARGPTLMLGYYGDPQATEAAMRPGGWFSTGDLGRRLEGGDYTIVGRCKDLIIRSGFNVYPGEVEAAILEHPAVARCAVVGRQASYGDEEVIAFVELAAGSEARPQDILAAAGRTLAGYKRPSRIVVLPDLPLGPTGKIAKARLKEIATCLDGAEQGK